LSAGSGLAGVKNSSSSSSHARHLASVRSASADNRPTAPSVLQPFHSSSSSHSSRTGLGTAGSSDALSAGQILALCGAVVEEQPAVAAAGISPLLLASLCLIESGGCPHAKQYREHLGDVALGLCQVSCSIVDVHIDRGCAHRSWMCTSIVDVHTW
jgi:hypothetical protein